MPLNLEFLVDNAKSARLEGKERHDNLTENVKFNLFRALTLINEGHRFPIGFLIIYKRLVSNFGSDFFVTLV